MALTHMKEWIYPFIPPSFEGVELTISAENIPEAHEVHYLAQPITEYVVSRGFGLENLLDESLQLSHQENSSFASSKDYQSPWAFLVSLPPSGSSNGKGFLAEVWPVVLLQVGHLLKPLFKCRVLTHLSN